MRVLRVLAVLSLAAGAAHAQDRVLEVVSTDSQPVSYAFVQANGGHAQLTDETGHVSMGRGKKQTFDVEVRRIGFTPFFGKIELPDTAITVRIVVTPLAQQLSSMRVTSRKSSSSLELNGFYKRWLDMQKGANPQFSSAPRRSKSATRHG